MRPKTNAPIDVFIGQNVGHQTRNNRPQRVGFCARGIMRTSFRGLRFGLDKLANEKLGKVEVRNARHWIVVGNERHTGIGGRRAVAVRTRFGVLVRGAGRIRPLVRRRYHDGVIQRLVTLNEAIKAPLCHGVFVCHGAHFMESGSVQQ